MPGLRIAQQQGLGALMVTARAALHEVGSQCEGRTGEADQRGGAELADQ
ncbi:Uncharacterised protein [Mycobacteroides abscessus subsp. abscessus]|nr:Uncharacterised protein [Mycobacteroides abscessus subsp. abscessus]